jgi:predicted AlkP superfamily pyrophosphatase or phosphodiesterase
MPRLLGRGARLTAGILLILSSPAMARPPRLTLFIVVDALGSDLLLRSRPYLKLGLAKLLSGGAYFPIARFEYAYLKTAPGHATLATGANPWRHGMVTNRLVNRSTGKLEPILGDPNHPILEAPPTSDDVSPQNLLTETLSDRLRVATHGRGKSVAIAGKPMAAILLAGRLGQAWWFNDSLGKFVTGTFYAKEFPAWVKAFNQRKLPETYFDKQWTLSLPAKEYLGEDDRPYERDSKGLGRTFPHPLTAGLSAPGPESYQALRSSPYLDEVLVQFAKAAMEGEGLGRHAAPDLLSISFSAFDWIYHLYGPYSWEIQDAMVKLDRSIGELLSAAERASGGKENLLVVLSADHGGAAIPEEWAAAGLPGIRLSPISIEQGLSKELLAKFGARVVSGVQGLEVYLNDAAMAENKLDGAAVRRAAAQWLSSQPELALATTKDELAGAGDRAGWLARWRKGYYPDRSGDVFFLPHPFVVVDSAKEGAEHGTPYAYDSEVPVIFWGKGVRSGIFRQAVSPVDVAPTVAALLEIGDPASVEGTSRSEIWVDAR